MLKTMFILVHHFFLKYKSQPHLFKNLSRDQFVVLSNQRNTSIDINFSLLRREKHPDGGRILLLGELYLKLKSGCLQTTNLIAVCESGPFVRHI